MNIDLETIRTRLKEVVDKAKKRGGGGDRENIGSLQKVE